MRLESAPLSKPDPEPGDPAATPPPAGLRAAGGPRRRARHWTGMAREEHDDAEGAAWETVWRLCSTSHGASERQLTTLGSLGGSLGGGSAGGNGGNGGNSVQGHVSLTRFNTARHRTICNLQPGEYKLFIFVYTGGGSDEDERMAMSPSSQSTAGEGAAGGEAAARSARSGSAETNRRHSLGLRNVLRTATFGKLGKLDVRADWELVSVPESGAGDAGVTQGSQIRRLQQFTEVVSLEDVPVREVSFTIADEDLPCQALFSLSSTSTVTSLNVAAQLYRRCDDEDKRQQQRRRRRRRPGVAEDADDDLSTEGDEPASKSIMISTADRVDLLEALLLEGSERSRGLLLTAAFLGFALGISSLSSIYLVFMFLVVAVTARGSGALFVNLSAGKPSSSRSL